MTGPLRLAALLVAALTACHHAGGGSGHILVVDDAGDTLRLAMPARRLVSLNPVITELVFALRTDRLADVSRVARLLGPLLGAGSFVSEMVELAGARNVFDDVSAASIAVSLEAIVSRAPRVVGAVGSMSADLARRLEWRAVPAVRAHRLLTLSDATLSHPTPRAPTAIAAIRRQLDSASRATAPKEAPQ